MDRNFVQFYHRSLDSNKITTDDGVACRAQVSLINNSNCLLQWFDLYVQIFSFPISECFIPDVTSTRTARSPDRLAQLTIFCRSPDCLFITTEGLLDHKIAFYN